MHLAVKFLNSPLNAIQLLLSVIIVNYNVKYFLEHCLLSVFKAGAGMAMEVIVVDNHSSDNSRDYLPMAFSQVKFIWLQENMGFSKANNIGVQQATGQYILFLNPDTIVPEDCFEKCLGFFAFHTNAGALGVRMTDGRGNFLRESKRGFPGLWVSFFKLSGMAGLFPNSRLFARYYMGHLPENEENKVPVLSGAFMMLPAKVLALTGGFDEVFFMYGEDIDLSYRIQKAGFHNYYYPGITIIHFKGESTIKATSQYVRTFYNAMRIFVRKHYSPVQSFLYNCMVSMAMFISIVMNAFRNVSLSKTNTAGNTKNEVIKIMVAGTEEECREVGGIISKQDNKSGTIKVERTDLEQVLASESGGELVLCEGKLSFKQMIHALPLLALKYTTWLHASGSKSILTSYSMNAKGKTIPAK